jgi:hypothetical protein
VTWSNQQRSKIIREYGMRSLTRSLPLPVLTRSNNDLRHKNRVGLTRHRSETSEWLCLKVRLALGSGQYRER